MASRLLARCVVFAAGFGLIAIAVQSVRAADATSRPAYPSANAPAANAQPAAVAPAAPSPKELRAAVADAMRRANSAKGAEIPAAAKSLVNLYHELGADVLLPARQRVRLGLQVRVRLQRFASQIRYEMAHNSSRPASIAATQTAAGSAGPAAAEGLERLVELIQTTIGQPDDWVAVQQNALGKRPADRRLPAALESGQAALVRLMAAAPSAMPRSSTRRRLRTGPTWSI